MSDEAAEAPLAGCFDKLLRAKTHLDDLQARIDPYLANAYDLRPEIDREDGLFLSRLVVAEPIPVEWSLIVGDAVHNMRSALDQAVCRLAECTGAEVTNDHKFPIRDTEPLTERARRRWDAQLEGVPDLAVEIIRRSQPFAGPQESPDQHALAALRELSNEDKHRVILSRHGSVQGLPGIEVGSAGERDLEVEGRAEIMVNRPLADGDVVIKMPITITGPNPRLDLSADLPFEPAFGSNMARASGLTQMMDAVGGVLAALQEVAIATEREQR